jgi:tRNA 2-thiouridine synthesizing protein A
VVDEVLDNRGLPPPQPLVRTLEVIDRWGPKPHVLVMIVDREPYLLYPELDERGLSYSVERRPEGIYVTIRTGADHRLGRRRA